jgi:universal stress protein A
MPDYSRILAAIDLTEDSRAVARRAIDIARIANGSLHLLHVIEFVPVDSMSETLVPVVQIDDQMMARARLQMAALATELGLPPNSTTVEAGSAKSEILRHARAQNVDLIVLGCRERHGLSILVNQTEDTVLHGAPCDVLAVRVR